MDKAGLLQLLKDKYQRWETLLAEIGPARLEQPGVNGDWSLKDLIAHLTGWQGWLAARFQAAQRGEPQPQPAWPASLRSDDEINAWIYMAYRDRSLRDILDETQRVFQQLFATIEALPDDAQIEFIEPKFYVVWLGGERYPPAEFFYHFEDDHEPDVRAWLAREAKRA